MAIPIHRAGGQAGLVGTLPRPTPDRCWGTVLVSPTSSEAPAARPHGWPGLCLVPLLGRPPTPAPYQVLQHVDGLAVWRAAGSGWHREQADTGTQPPSPLATSPSGHSGLRTQCCTVGGDGARTNE